jgi:hypothetical protein
LDAQHGDGFYVAIGDKGGGSRNGPIIRFRMKPNARKGKDFEVVNGGSYLVILNKDAFDVLPEVLQEGLLP